MNNTYVWFLACQKLNANVLVLRVVFLILLLFFFPPEFSLFSRLFDLFPYGVACEIVLTIVFLSICCL